MPPASIPLSSPPLTYSDWINVIGIIVGLLASIVAITIGYVTWREVRRGHRFLEETHAQKEKEKSAAWLDDKEEEIILRIALERRKRP
jgi:uncharacterized iron-regulated membrane protein